MKSKKIKVDYLARVEGEGGLTVKVRNGKVADATFDIFEPPRLFEAFLRGRRFTEAPDITARICGICPIAYQMSSVHAMEYGCGVRVGGQLRELRRLIYCGEWIESHALHIYMLHAPDFLGYEDAIQMAADYPDIVTNALRLKKIGNDIMVLLGGREIHPINVRVGGFYSVPSRKDLETLVEPLQWAVNVARETVKWTAGLDFPDFERDFEFVSLRHPDEYPLCEGRIVSTKGLDIAIEDFFTYFEELHVEHSTSLHSVIKERGEYHVGPLARYNNNFDKLPPEVQDAAREVGLAGTVTNPFKSIVVRALETLYACYEALRIIENYSPPPRPYIDVPPRLATTSGASEAPRGLLVHKYTIDDDGIIQSARIVPPTAQNQKVIESDLAEFVGDNLELPHDKLTWKCEQIVRNYDPCISCSCHFLKLKIERE